MTNEIYEIERKEVINKMRKIEVCFSGRTSGKTTKLIKMMKESVAGGETFAFIGANRQKCENMKRMVYRDQKTTEIFTTHKKAPIDLLGHHPVVIYADDVKMPNIKPLYELLTQTKGIIGYGNLSDIATGFETIRNAYDATSTELAELRSAHCTLQNNLRDEQAKTEDLNTQLKSKTLAIQQLVDRLHDVEDTTKTYLLECVDLKKKCNEMEELYLDATIALAKVMKDNFLFRKKFTNLDGSEIQP